MPYFIYIDQHDVVLLRRELANDDRLTLVATFDNERDARSYFNSFNEQEPIGDEY